MILRSVMRHVQDQNWFAVGIDFLIVIVGVFIGIQVANWNDARRESAAEAALLDRLHEEFTQLEPGLRDWLEQVLVSAESTGIVVDALRREAPPEDEQAFRFALARANWVASVPEISTTYKELVATGRLSELDDPQLRNSLTRYGEVHARVERVNVSGTQVVFNPLQNYFRAVDWQMDPTLWESAQAIVDYDWELLRASRAEMQAWIAFQHDLAVFGQDEMDAVEEILELLEGRGR
jgi:hypothetical protein